MSCGEKWYANLRLSRVSLAIPASEHHPSPPGLTMQCRWYRLDLAAMPRGVVIVDATLATQPLWDGPLLSIFEEINEKLPAEARPEVVFLGDRRCQPFSKLFGAQAGNSLASGAITPQLGRYPVVGPFLREWIRTSPRPLVLVTNTVVEDLEDWAVSEVVAALLIYRLTGSERLTPPPVREIEADLEVLVEHLRDPLLDWRVGGRGVFAIDWQPADLTRESGSLHGSAAAAGNLHVLLAHPDECVPRCELRRTSGCSVFLPLSPASPPASDEEITLSEAETSVLRNWRSGQPFFCSSCQTKHNPGQLRCESNPEKGILPSLAKYPVGMAWKLKLQRRWIAQPAARGICVVEDSILVNRNGLWEAYSLVEGEWLRAEPPELFMSLGEDEFLFPG